MGVPGGVPHARRSSKCCVLNVCELVLPDFRSAPEKKAFQRSAGGGLIPRCATVLHRWDVVSMDNLGSARE